MSIIPQSRPQLTKELEAQIRGYLKEHNVVSPVALVGIRGYYSSTFAPAGNNRGVYDDALFVVTNGSIASFNFNADPSIYKRGIATLEKGVIYYVKGKHNLSRPHKMYDALRPASAGWKVRVRRDGLKGLLWGTALNIHRGGNSSTESEGCQTLPPAQWPEFINLIYGKMSHFDVTKVPYLLIEK